MAQRRFGPTLGAGVVLDEADSEKTISPAPLGVTLYIGQLLKGAVGELIHAPSRGDTLKKVGGYLEGSQVPDAAADFWNLGQGAGELYFIRVTDGTEIAASDTFFSRHTGHGPYVGPLDSSGYNETKRALLTVTAKNGGRWGGRALAKSGTVATVGTDITATTLDTGDAMAVDRFKGATLSLAGVSAKSYTVVGNDAAGVITVEADQNMASDLALGGSPSAAGYRLLLDQEVLTYPTQIAGTRRAVSVLWKDGQESESSLFGLEVYEDGAKVIDYPNLSLDPASKWYAPTVINGDTSNFWIEVDALFSGAITADVRPANWYGQALEWASDTLTVEILHVHSITSANANTGWVDKVTIPGTAITRRVRLVVTFTGATTYTVTTDPEEGADLQNLGGGTVGTAFVPAAGSEFAVGFTVQRGINAWTTGDVIVLDLLPLPVDADGEGLLRGFLFYDVGTNPRAKIKIKSNTVNTITLVTAPTVAPTEATRAPSSEFFSTGTLTFPLTLSNTTLTLGHSSFGRVSLTLAAGPHASAAALATEINTRWQSATSSSGTIATAVGAAVRFHIDSGTGDAELGYSSFLRVFAVNADLNLAVNDHVAGLPGAEFRVQALSELRGGYDGQAPAAADFLALAASPPDSLVSRFFGQNKGLVKIATPGQTDTTIQSAFLELASAFGYQYRVEVPSSVTDDSAAVAFINDTLGRNDFGVVSFPSYANVPNPRGAGTVLRTLTGAIHGREALVAKNFQGYHKAAAGVDVTLPNVVSLPTGDRILNEEVLNPQGLNAVKKVKGNYVLWGDRTIALDPAWKWKHQREQMSHYERQLLEGFDFIVFAINDKATQADLITTLTVFFLPEFTKRALRGDSFKDAVSIKIDDTNNTNLTRAAGDLNAEIRLRLADTVERFIIRIGKAGVFEDLG